MSSVASDSFVMLNSPTSMQMASCSIINIDELDEYDRPMANGGQEEDKLDPYMLAYFDRSNEVSADGQPASLQKLASKALTTSTHSNHLDSSTVGHLATIRIQSLPADCQNQLSKESDKQRNCISLENNIETNCALITESINVKSLESEDEEPEMLDFKPEVIDIQNGVVDAKALEAYLVSLREENDKLKHIVVTNNETMKRQLKIAKEWQEEVNCIRKSYNQLKQDSEDLIAKLKNDNEELKVKLIASEVANPIPVPISPIVAAAEPQSVENSYLWDNMSIEINEFKLKLDRIPILEAELVRKNAEIEQLTSHLDESKSEIKQLVLQIAEVKLQQVRERGCTEQFKNQLEQYAKQLMSSELARKVAEDEAMKFEEQLEQMKADREELLERLDLGPAVVNLSEASDTMSTSRSGRHRSKRHHRRHSGQVAGSEGLILEGYRKYRVV
ncbi:hypothetical protein HDE_07906 [Halotydeus destructor]|nr:hypothetical protein HDE_07906 [Halotydeus destructor]